MYTGQLTLLGLEYARRNNLQPLILSAKYGLIPPDQIIETYNQKRTEPYEGPWPEGEGGFYLGGVDYFSKAPPQFQPLVPKELSFGQSISYLTRVLEGNDLKKSPVGIVAFIYSTLLQHQLTKEELYQHLCQEFGNAPGMKITINCQLTAKRMGTERQCTIHKEGKKYWITPGLPPQEKKGFGLL